MFTVIRVIKYECENEDIMRSQIAGSMAEGVHNKGNKVITVATYFSDLPPEPLVALIDNEKLHSVLNEVAQNGQETSE